MSVGRCVGGGGVEIPPSLSSLSLTSCFRKQKKAKHVPRKLPATADRITVTRCVLVAGDCGG